MGHHVFEFAAPVLPVQRGLVQHGLPIPEDVAEALLRNGRRVLAELNGHRVSRAIHRDPEVDAFLVMSRGILRAIGAAPGDLVVVNIWSDPDPDHVDIPEEFEAVLDQDEAAASRFDAMTPGMKRSLVHYIASAKRTETRIKRSFQMAERLRTGTLYGDRHPE